MKLDRYDHSMTTSHINIYSKELRQLVSSSLEFASVTAGPHYLSTFLKAKFKVLGFEIFVEVETVEVLGTAVHINKSLIFYRFSSFNEFFS